ncbi:hypothetical protein V9T40_004788 [Parthenolecanium corni]|uniref:Uncharacterized protein n=1 Tax=Parthenolecanium corni TaxID=536013 RepID=A0AAN9TF43_9HEMI
MKIRPRPTCDACAPHAAPRRVARRRGDATGLGEKARPEGIDLQRDTQRRLGQRKYCTYATLFPSPPLPPPPPPPPPHSSSSSSFCSQHTRRVYPSRAVGRRGRLPIASAQLASKSWPNYCRVESTVESSG